MKVIVPAAGIGTRLRPLTYTMPKSLIYVAGKPILGHIIHTLPSDVGELIVVVGYMGERVREYVDDSFDMPRRFIFQEERLGLGHAVWMALQGIDEEEVLIVLGDTIIETDFSRLLSMGTSAIGVREVDDPRRFGVVEVKNGRITRIVEKPLQPKSNLIVAGIYYIKRARLLFECLRELIDRGRTTRGEFQLTDALQLMVERGEPMGVSNVDVWLDCGETETLLATNRYLLKKFNTKTTPRGSLILPPVYIADTARIRRSIVGPYVSIGENAEISGSMLRNSLINAGSVVRNVSLTKSIVGYETSVSGSLRNLSLGDGCQVSL